MVAVQRRRGQSRVIGTRLRRLIVHTAVRTVGCGVAGFFGLNGLYALASLRGRCADGRIIKRCRAVTASESGGSNGGRGGKQYSGKNLGLHGGFQ
jgi:hypothetical protein